MDRSDAIDILENCPSTANLLDALEIIDHYEEPVNITLQNLFARDMLKRD